MKCRDCLEQEAGADGLCDRCRPVQFLRQIDSGDLPWFYRVILKIPYINRIENASGIFWILGFPLLLFLNFMLGWVFLFALPFPINIATLAVTPVLVLIALVRLGLERFLNLWNMLVGRSGFEWDVDKKTKEYVALLKEQEKTRRNSTQE